MSLQCFKDFKEKFWVGAFIVSLSVLNPALVRNYFGEVGVTGKHPCPAHSSYVWVDGRRLPLYRN